MPAFLRSLAARPAVVSSALVSVLAACSSGGAATPWDAGRWGGGSDGGTAARADGAVFWGSDAAAAPPWDAGPPGVDAGPPGEDAGELADAGEIDAAVDRCANRTSREPVTLYLSADDSNSMASPVIARRILRSGGYPAGFLRTYEFLNYYYVRYPSPESGHVAVVPEMREGDEEGEYVLQLGVQAAPPPATPQRRVITLVLDRSGSMAGEPIELERAAVLAIARSLRAGDIVSAVTWNTERDVPFENHVVTGSMDPILVSLAASLAADGGTDLNAGLRFGYEIAQRLYDPERLNRVVAISDGVANAGVTEIDIIDDASEDAEADGIYLVGVGVGDGVNDTMMDAITDAGRGAYVYLDSNEEADAIFGPRWAETMEVGLLAVRAELTLPWYMAVTEFHGEEISGTPERVRPQHLAPGDTMVFHQVIEPCDASLVDDADPIAVRATYTRPEGRVEAADATETTFGALLASPHPHLDRGDVIVEYAEGLALGEGMRDGVSGRDRLMRALELADVVDPDGTDPAMEEIRELAGLALAHLGT